MPRGRHTALELSPDGNALLIFRKTRNQRGGAKQGAKRLASSISGHRMVVSPKRVTFEVWARLILSQRDCDRIRDFLVFDLGVKPEFVVRRMHVTVYHARRPMFGLTPLTQRAHVVIPASETRFMVMAPGGENPRPNLDPAKRKVGIRIKRNTESMAQIIHLRERLLQYETRVVLGSRSPSTRRTSAFGARSFQAHMAILRAGSGIHGDLTGIGLPFREQLGDFLFDRFEVEVVRNEAP